jgi:hypothetical protein
MPEMNEDARLDAISELSDAIRRLTQSLYLLAAAIEKLDTPRPVAPDPVLTRVLARLTSRCNMPIAKYLRRY